MISEKNSNFIKNSNSDFNLKFWSKVDKYNLKTAFSSNFPTLPLFFQLCPDFYVLSIRKVTISKPLMMESWNFHRLFRIILYIDDLHFGNHSWKNDCAELKIVWHFEICLTFHKGACHFLTVKDGKLKFSQIIQNNTIHWWFALR